MVDVVTILRAFGGLFLLLMNAYFVVIEFAMTRVRQFDEQEFGESSGLRRAWEMTDRLEIYLSGCQLGITIASVGLGVVAEPAVAKLFTPLVKAVGLGQGSTHALSAILALGLINLLHVIVGEQAPTYLGIERTKFVARHGSGLLYWWAKLLYPVIVVADKVAKALLGLFGVKITRSWTEAEEGEDGGAGGEIVSRADLHREMGDVLSQVDHLSEEREEEILAAMEIEMVPIRDIMVPREDIVALSTNDSIEENLERMEANPLVRFPVIGESFDEYRGIVYTPSVVSQYDALRAGEISLTDIAHEPMSIAGDTSVADAIDLFQAENQELALVLDGEEVVGVVTATDAFEAVLGELEDPTDRESAVHSS
ncbi:CNNM domain-containing protein [Haladaptatus caseinilyticus]|uniref:CNNM domain-containing protein n=1 Tax=Haladaptatus caseinilyticus TaxID=2993314 RepID=UPI00224B074B|nr:hemolysin family protein [Haladaptatus caseinilyticus]